MYVRTYVGLHVKHLLFLPDLIKLEFSQHIFEKNPQIPNFIKIRLVEAELFHADRDTDRRTNRHDEANSRFSYKTARILIYNFSFNLHMTPMFHAGLIALKYH